MVPGATDEEFAIDPLSPMKQELGYAKKLMSAVATAFMLPGDLVHPDPESGSNLNEIVTHTGAPIAQHGVPTPEALERAGTFIGTESIGTDAWRLYRYQGKHYRITAWPKASPDLGRVFVASDTDLPPLYQRPALQRAVTTEESKVFSSTQISTQYAAARVEVAQMRAEQRRRDNEQALREARYVLESSASTRQREQWVNSGFYDVFTPLGHRYRVLPAKRRVYRIGPRDEPISEHWISEDEISPDAVARYIAKLGSDPATFLERAQSRPYSDQVAPWPLLSPMAGMEAAGRIYALQIA